MLAVQSLQELKFELEQVTSKKAKILALQTLPQINMMLKKYEIIKEQPQLIANVNSAIESFLNDKHTKDMISFIRRMDE